MISAMISNVGGAKLINKDVEIEGKVIGELAVSTGGRSRDTRGIFAAENNCVGRNW